MSKHAPGLTPGLSGVPETMLWPLYDRATEARLPEGSLRDPEAIRILDAIDYDFAGRFGAPGGSLAARAAAIDGCVVRWLGDHPDGLVVSLGEGLETQSRRIDNGRMRWLTVDLPDSIRLREEFLPPTNRFQHLALSALDPAWMDQAVPGPVCVVAQGLFMYLERDAVAGLLQVMARQLRGATLVFDTIPPWLSRLTLRGLDKTAQYRLPRMPWGIAHDDIEPTLRRWCRGLGAVEFLPYAGPRGIAAGMTPIMAATPVLRDQLPCIVVTHFA